MSEKSKQEQMQGLTQKERLKNQQMVMMMRNRMHMESRKSEKDKKGRKEMREEMRERTKKRDTGKRFAQRMMVCMVGWV
jgi:hypothetical protein